MSRAEFEPWQVWLVDFGVPAGNEQGGTRPGVVVSSDARIRLRGDTTLMVPLTTRDRGWPHHVAITSAESGLNQASWARTEDVRSVSARRLARSNPLGALSQDEIRDVQRWVRRMIDA